MVIVQKIYEDLHCVLEVGNKIVNKNIHGNLTCMWWKSLRSLENITKALILIQLIVCLWKHIVSHPWECQYCVCRWSGTNRCQIICMEFELHWNKSDFIVMAKSQIWYLMSWDVWSIQRWWYHWPLGDVAVIWKVQFSESWQNSS